MSELINQLLNLCGPERFTTAQDLKQRATSYWNGEPTNALCLVYPSTTEQVSKILKLCHEHNQPVVTQGGLTGCVQAAHSSSNEVIISLQKMNRIGEFDEVGATLTVEAGVVLEQLQQYAKTLQMLFPVDLGARGSCTIGGNIATNAGGINVLRYGMTRNQILGLEVVTADGTILNLMNQMLKNNTGYDLKQLFIGSEGTLGIVTRAVLKLAPIQPDSNCAIVALNSFADVASMLHSAQNSLHGSLSAFEVMWGEYYDAVTVFGAHRPVLDRSYPFYVLLEITHNANQHAQASFEQLLEQQFEQGIIVDAALPKSEQDRKAMWDIRENFEAIVNKIPLYMYDISLPVREMNIYINGLKQSLEQQSPGTQCYTFGHIADGNLHLFIQPGDISTLSHEQSDDLVYQPLQSFGGAISAEHGIGNEKKAALAKYADPGVLALMKSLKQTMDPKGILNPGRIFDPS